MSITRVAGLLKKVHNSLKLRCQNLLINYVGVLVYHHLKTMWLGELSENIHHLSMSTAVLEEETIDVNVRLNHAVRQQFARTLSDRYNYEFTVT